MDPSFLLGTTKKTSKADEFQRFFLGGERMCCEMVNLYLDPLEIEETSQGMRRISRQSGNPFSHVLPEDMHPPL